MASTSKDVPKFLYAESVHMKDITVWDIQDVLVCNSDTCEIEINVSDTGEVFWMTVVVTVTCRGWEKRPDYSKLKIYLFIYLFVYL
jgi:hypothetical protein